MNVVDTGLVYRNPLPQVYSRHAYFPSVVVTEGGEMVVSMDIGSAFEALDVRSYLCRSTDGGQTWSSPAIIFEPDISRHAVSLTTRFSRMGDGTLSAWACQFERSRTDCGLVNEGT